MLLSIQHDPLGIQITEGKAQQPPTPTPLPAGSPGLAPVRRKSSVDGHPLSPTMRKDMLKGYVNNQYMLQ